MREIRPLGAPETIVLVEGESDRLAVEALAARLGVDLASRRIRLIPMDGITNLRHHLAALTADPADSPAGRVLGLFDRAEIEEVRRFVDGAGPAWSAADLETLGFYACDPDLEGELIRALGGQRVEELLDEHGELGRFRTFQRQPAQRERPLEAQLRRFMGTHSGRKARFAPIFVRSLEVSRIPAGLGGLVTALQESTTSRESTVGERRAVDSRHLAGGPPAGIRRSATTGKWSDG